jgi:hypothetical protein
MTRACATLMLLMLLFFLAVLPWAYCECDSSGACDHSCDWFCKDNCNQSPLPHTPRSLGPALSLEQLAGLIEQSPDRQVDPPELPPPRR